MHCRRMCSSPCNLYEYGYFMTTACVALTLKHKHSERWLLPVQWTAVPVHAVAEQSQESGQVLAAFSRFKNRLECMLLHDHVEGTENKY